MRLDRREVIVTGAAAALALVFAGAAGALSPARAAASADDAAGFVRKMVAEVTTLVQSGKTIDAQAREFSDLFARYAAVPQVTRFVMGRVWREMSEAQQLKAQDAVVTYVGRVYTGLLNDYQGQTLEVTGATDFGAKGVLVKTAGRGEGVEDTEVEWLVSDRGGDGLKLVDVVAEGVSLLQSQRQEFAAMIEKRGGDIDVFIADLAAGRISGE